MTKVRTLRELAIHFDATPADVLGWLENAGLNEVVHDGEVISPKEAMSRSRSDKYWDDPLPDMEVKTETETIVRLNRMCGFSDDGLVVL